MSEAMLGVYRTIGEDRYVSASELPPESGAFGRAAWEIYDRHFGRFTGAALDPGLARFDRPDMRFGIPLFPSARPVVVVTEGPVAAQDADALHRHRAEVVLMASLDGVAALQAVGLAADLVFVERTPPGGLPDRGLDPGPGTCLVDPAAAVGAWERRRDTRWLARSTYSWGAWPTSAVATALAGGAMTVVLLGPSAPDPRATRAAEASDALLTLLAQIPGARFVDLDHATPRRGWERTTLDGLVTGAASASARIEWRDDGGFDGILAGAMRDAQRVAAILPDAQRALQLAQRARAGASIPARELTRTIETVLAWGCDPCLRWTLQRTLGLTFLPRLWRTGISMAVPHRLWRPLMLAVHELTEQAQRLESRLSSRTEDTGRGALLVDPLGAHMAGSSRGQARGAHQGLDATRVSVVVPVVDQHAHVAAAVRSLIDQTYANLEVLVVYDPRYAGACDGVRGMVDSRIRLLECSGGLAHAMNVGLEAATGGLIALHGADDLSHPQRMARQVTYLETHPDIAIVATATAVVDEAGSPMHLSADAATSDDTWTPEAIERHLLFGRCFEAGSVLARRNVIEWAGGYRARLASAPDQDLWLRLLPTSRFAKLPTRLHARRIVARHEGAALARDLPVASSA